MKESDNIPPRTSPETSQCHTHEEMVAYLYQEAAADEASRFESHLNDCASCQEEMAAFGRVRDQLQQWQLADLPVLRVVAETRPERRSFLAVLKELFAVMPIWIKAASLAAMALVVMAATGSRVSIGRDGIALSSGFGTKPSANVPTDSAPPARVPFVRPEQLEQVRADLNALVSERIAASEREQKEQLKTELVSLQAELKNLRTADLAKIVARVQEHQSRLLTIERDLDRREGSDITDLLFSELTTKENRAPGMSRGD